MSKLIQKVKWNLDGSNTEMYMYGEADFESNEAMQEPLEKLYQYENQPDMREKVREYIDELNFEFIRCVDESESILTVIRDCNGKIIMSKYVELIRLANKAVLLQEIANDLKGRLEERV